MSDAGTTTGNSNLNATIIHTGLPVIGFTKFHAEAELKEIQNLIDKELSEPYSLYTYRYFVYNWPKLCLFARHEERYVGVIVCKMELLENNLNQGYIAMLAVHPDYRRQGIANKLVEMAIEAMMALNAFEIVLETEVNNKAALRLYESLGFIREQRMLRYYLNNMDALRLKLQLRLYPKDI